MDDDASSDSNTKLAEHFTIKSAASQTRRSTRQCKDAAPEACTICLESITERAVAVPCNHLTFDFLCLVSWLQERATCPLCKADVREVQYDWRGPENYKTHHVPVHEEPSSNSQSAQAPHVRSRRLDRHHIERWTPQAERVLGASKDPALDRRRRVYRDKLFSLHVGANPISQYRDFTALAFAQSVDLQSRARAFLRRELQVFSFLDPATTPRGNNKDSLAEYIVAILKTNELKGSNGHAEDLLADFLGRENAGRLLHELEAWLRSPYGDLREWDRHVQYSIDGSGRATEVEAPNKVKLDGNQLRNLPQAPRPRG